VTKQIEVCGMTDFVFEATDNPKVKVMMVADTKKNISGSLVNPEALGLILEQALTLAAQWSQDPNLAIHELTGPSRHLPVSHVSVSMVPDNREVLLNLFVGQVQMSYLISIDALMSGLQPLLSTLDWSGVHEIKPN